MKIMKRLTRLAVGFSAVLMCSPAIAGQPNICQAKHTQGAARIVQSKSSLDTLEEVLLRQIGQGKVCVNPASRYSQIKFDPKYFEETILGNSLIAQINGNASSPRGLQRQPANLELQKQASRSLLNLPIHFEAIADKTYFRARGVGYDFVLNGSEVLVQIRTNNPEKDEQEHIKLRLTSPGAKPSSPAGEAQIPGKANYLFGKDQTQWKTDIPLYGKVRYPNVYEGIDRVFYGTQGELEYDWIVAPGADPQIIRERIEGADDISIDTNGDLVIKSGSASIRHRRPVAYQVVDEGRVPIKAVYQLAENGEIGFDIGEYDKSRPLVIDPVLSYGALLPMQALLLNTSNGGDTTSAAVDSAGNLYIAGVIFQDFVPNNFFDQNSFRTYGGNGDAFVLKLNAAGTAIDYVAYLGGDSSDRAEAIAVDATGGAVFAGTTQSQNFPTVNAIQTSFAGGSAAFVAKLNPAGNGLVFSTVLSGSDTESNECRFIERVEGYGVALDRVGNIYVSGSNTFCGFGSNWDFAITPGAYRAVGNSFVTKMTPTGQMIFSARYPGTTSANFIAVDGEGSSYIHGATNDPNLTLVNPAQSAAGIFLGRNSSGTFIAKFSSSGSELLYSTYFGGSNGAGGIAIDSGGHAWVTGATSAPNFPLPPVGNILFSFRPLIQTNRIQAQTYVAKMSPDGGRVEALVWLSGLDCNPTCLIAPTLPGYIAIDGADNVYVGGSVIANNGVTDFPEVNAIPSTVTTARTYGFISKIIPSGQGLDYSTLIPVNRTDGVRGGSLAVSTGGDAYLIGDADNAFQPTPGAYLAGTTQISNPFVVKIGSTNSSSVVITSSKNPETVGRSVTLTASVIGNSPTGSATFKEGNAVLGTIPLSGNGTASIVLSSLNVGTHTITATYSGDANNPPRESLPLTQVINPIPAATGIVVNASATGIPLSGTIQLTASVSGSNSPSGTVLFKDGATVLGTAALGVSLANLSLNSGALAAGVHSIVAEYQGDAFNFASSSSPVSITVAAPPTIAVATPSQGSTILSTDPISYSIIAAPNGLATISSVVLRVNGQIIATLTAPPYTLSLAQAPPGSFTVDAIATDSYGQTSQSAPITYTVQQNGPVTTYLHQDLTGNTIAATDVNGNLLYTEQYRPYGERLTNNATSQATQPLGNRIWFHGKVQDEATGLQDFGARSYDPLLGIFMGFDPVGFDERNIHSFNRYAYGNNNPYRYRDPDGNVALPLIIFGIGLYTVLEVANAPGATDLAQATPTLEKMSALVPGGNIGGGPLVTAMIKRNAGKVDDVAKEVAKGVTPNAEQAANLNRFQKKIPSNSRDSVELRELPNGGVAAQATSPGKVPGSKAIYEKQIDVNGKTVQTTKTTYDPQGKIVHVKDKLNGGTYP